MTFRTAKRASAQRPLAMQTTTHKTLLASALGGCLLLSVATVQAQSASSTLRGRVDGAQAGATVTATNVADGSSRRTTANADGSYTLVGLAPGTYKVDAGGAPQTVTVSVASTATLNLSAGGGAPTDANATNLDTVTVTAPPLQDLTKSEVGANVSLRQITTVPQISRNFLEFADAVPGMVFERDASGRTSLKGGAQNASGTNLYIDGVGQKSYVKQGGVGGQFDSAGNPFPQSAIGEYKVITSNYKAEYGQISSAAVTAVTKSGTNDVTGEVFYRYTGDNLRARTAGEEAPGTRKAQTQEREYGFSVGGPIIQDRMHFLASIEKKEFALPTLVGLPDNAPPGSVGLLPGSVAAEYGPTAQPFDEELFFAKIDWDVTDRDHIALSAQRRDENAQRNIEGQTAPSAGIQTENFDRRYSLRWEHSGDSFFNELLGTYEDSFNNPVPLTFGNGFTYLTPDPTNPNGDITLIRVGAADPRAGQTKGQKGWSIEDNLTFTGLQWNGEHTVKMGVRYKKVDLTAADALNANPQFSYVLGAPNFSSDQPYQAVFPKPVSGAGSLSPVAKSSSEQYGAYIQDDWQVNEHLLLNLGVRWDYEKTPSYLDFRTPQNVIDALNAANPDQPGTTYAQSLLAGGINVNDYISNGRNRKAPKNDFAPRLGMSYDINADQKHVIHAGAGRSYDRNLYDFLQLEVTKSALPQLTVNFRDPLTGRCYRGASPCFDWDPNYLNGLQNLQALVAASNTGVEVDLLNNKLKTPYSDQFSLGMSNVVGDWTTDATITRILSHDGFAFTLGNRYPDGSYFNRPVLCDPGNADLPNENQVPFGCPIPGFGALILGNNGIETRSTQVLLSAQKPYSKASGWGATFAYTFTNAKQNRDINETYSFDFPTIQDFPYLDTNSVPRHRLVATGSLDGAWGITYGGKLTLATPTVIYTTRGVSDNSTVPPGVPVGTLVAAKPEGTLGFKSLDLQATKEFDLDGLNVYARLDLLNVFNWRNLVNASDRDDSPGGVRFRYNRFGDISGVPRTLRFEVGARF